jgi:hypothetical protein
MFERKKWQEVNALKLKAIVSEIKEIADECKQESNDWIQLKWHK